MGKDELQNDLTVEDENGLYEHFSFKADPGQSPLRVDKFLMDRVENATRNKIQQAAKGAPGPLTLQGGVAALILASGLHPKPTD